MATKQSTGLKLSFAPKDVHGNLVGPGRGPAIKVCVDKGTLKGMVEDLLDGGYSAEIEAADSRFVQQNNRRQYPVVRVATKLRSPLVLLPSGSQTFKAAVMCS